MFVRHTLTATGTCPNNGLADHYRIAVYTSGVLFCERIVEAVDELLTEPIFQEAFTQALADCLGCRVRTRCRHPHGGRVRTDCVCCPRPALAPDAA